MHLGLYLYQSPDEKRGIRQGREVLTAEFTDFPPWLR